MINSTNPSENLILTLENPPFCVYLICVCLLVLKMMGLAVLTVFYRFKNQAFISPEDAKWRNGEVAINESVERVRRAHQNDLENILIFFAAAFAYLWTLPPVWVAWFLFLGFTIIRILHTAVYTLFVIQQPARATLWTLGFIITGYMAIHSAIHALLALI